MAVIVVTGANSGFGFHGSLAFARKGDTVLAAVRNPERAGTLLEMAERENLDIHIEELDVTDEQQFQQFVNRVVTRHSAIDVLVNNAGILLPGALEDLANEDFRRVVDTNCIGPLLLARAVLPQMRKQGSGHIIMMSSLSGIAGLPGDVAYTASKFGLEGAAEALRHEVDRWGIRVSLVVAGMYDTGIFRDADGALPSEYPADSVYRPLIENQLQGIAARRGEAFNPEIVGRLFVHIANSDENRLRWPADAVAEKVLGTVFAHTDAGRDRFLRDVAGSDWWSKGADGPSEDGE